MKRPPVPVIVLLLAAAGGGAWVALNGNPFADPDGPLVLYGNVDIREVSLAFRVGGRVAEMRREEGEAVAPGVAVATLDPAPFDREVRAAEAEAAARRAELAKLRAGYRPEEIAQAEAVVAERRASLTNAARVLARQRDLRKSGAASQQALDDARAATLEARARLTSAEKNLELLRAGYRDEDVAAAAARLAAAEAALASARLNRDDCVLTVPEAGVVLTRAVEPGAMVASGSPVYVVALDHPVRVRAYVDEPHLGAVKPGLAVTVSSDSFPGKTFPARVGFVSPTAEFTPKSVETPELRTDLVYRLRLVVDDPRGDLRQGMPVTVRLPDAAP